MMTPLETMDKKKVTHAVLLYIRIQYYYIYAFAPLETMEELNTCAKLNN